MRGLRLSPPSPRGDLHLGPKGTGVRPAPAPPQKPESPRASRKTLERVQGRAGTYPCLVVSQKTLVIALHGKGPARKGMSWNGSPPPPGGTWVCVSRFLTPRVPSRPLLGSLALRKPQWVSQSRHLPGPRFYSCELGAYT